MPSTTVFVTQDILGGMMLAKPASAAHTKLCPAPSRASSVIAESMEALMAQAVTLRALSALSPRPLRQAAGT